MESARQVGGDFTIALHCPDGRICAVVGDVSGKGCCGGNVSFAKTLIHEKMTENAEPSTGHLKEINKELCSSNRGMFVTAFAVIFDKNSDSFA